jgi:DNA-directed RNA polymerase specialized sigma24 family protein
MDLATYRRLRIEACRVVRKTQDADDLVQDALLIALENGRDGHDDLAWLSGVLRNRAAMQARSAIRRRRRETVAVIDDIVPDSEREPQYRRESVQSSATALLERLPPAARRVAVLALHGLNADEIRWILGLSATAFRQRLTSIRKTMGALPPQQRAEALALAYVRDPARTIDLQFGLIRRALKSALRGADGIGTHDSDGHLIVVRTIVRNCAHTSTSSGN